MVSQLFDLSSLKCLPVSLRCLASLLFPTQELLSTYTAVGILEGMFGTLIKFYSACREIHAAGLVLDAIFVNTRSATRDTYCLFCFSVWARQQETPIKSMNKAQTIIETPSVLKPFRSGGLLQSVPF